MCMYRSASSRMPAWTTIVSTPSPRAIFCADARETDDFRQLRTFSILLGALFLAAALIELLGVASCFTQRLAIIRAYAFGSVLSALLIVAGSLISVIVHFSQKSEIIGSCEKLVTSSDLNVSFGWFGSHTSDQLTPSQAAEFCQDGWNHESWSSILVLLAEIVLSALFSVLAFTYYRQCLDPTSTANAFRAPSNQMRAEGAAYPGHYNRPYNNGGALSNLSYDAPFAPPPGPPPQFAPMHSEDDLGKPPMYHEGGYGGGMGMDKDGMDKGGKADDPFADFEGDPLRKPCAGWLVGF
ncbi:hypothetical protein FIBSPDRAFT_919601 [Athelia psychrophila]|uniref:Uncharacterized protein n=1 Tax=Athelia psychrophila TaxID=1759441 RepID=A0A166JWN8_9AGAM|nr:hypothetical protein FIBSPDRAFT_919601 [Fibularhizoctonia sp. CBS 109695]